MSIISTTKELVDLAKKGATVELELRLVQMQQKELELREEIVRLKTTISEIEKNAAIETDLELANGMYMRGNSKYCQLCWDSERVLINLQENEKLTGDDMGRVFADGVYYRCLKCKSNYGT